MLNRFPEAVHGRGLLGGNFPSAVEQPVDGRPRSRKTWKVSTVKRERVSGTCEECVAPGVGDQDPHIFISDLDEVSLTLIASHRFQASQSSAQVSHLFGSERLATRILFTCLLRRRNAQIGKS